MLSFQCYILSMPTHSLLRHTYSIVSQQSSYSFPTELRHILIVLIVQYVSPSLTSLSAASCAPCTSRRTDDPLLPRDSHLTRRTWRPRPRRIYKQVTNIYTEQGTNPFVTSRKVSFQDGKYNKSNYSDGILYILLYL